MRTILYLSPVAWNCPNTQIRELVQLLSKDYRILYLDCYSLEFVSLKHFILHRKKRAAVIQTWKSILTSKQVIIPVFLTRNRYSQSERTSRIDGWLVVFQIQLMLMVMKSANCVYANTSFFPFGLTKLSKMKWVFDFYDRSYDVTSQKNNEIMRANEKWLLEKSELVLVKSKNYLSNVIPTIEPIVSSKLVLTTIGYSVKKHLKMYPNSNMSTNKIIIGYAGGLSERLDYRLIIDSVENFPQVTFVFAGCRFDNTINLSKMSFAEFSKKLLSYPNVLIQQNSKSKTQQAMTMSKFTFGWIPYDTSEYFNIYCHPTKFLEYMAVGLPVLSTRIPSLIEHEKYVSFIDSSKAISTILQNANTLLTTEKIHQRKQFAIEHRIENRYTQVSSLMKAVI